MGSFKGSEIEKTRIMLGLLESVGRGEASSQRRLASDLGVALGLVNTYIKRCVNKGLLKVSEAPTRRYAYYLTPNGFSEKARLTVEYLSYSFSLFRQAKTDYRHVLKQGRERGFRRIALIGASDLAEIAVICALDDNITITAVVDAGREGSQFCGVPVVSSIGDIESDIDAVLLAEMTFNRAGVAALRKRLGADRVLVPAFLIPDRNGGVAS